MANMGHCRFQNTLADLKDCNLWLSENEPMQELSTDEYRAFKLLVRLCGRIADDYGVEE